MRRLATLAVLLPLTLGGCAESRPGTGIADLTNAALSPAYSQWLIGPVAHLATVEEVRQYLALPSDDEAARFIDAFWARRNPHPASSRNAARELFEKRCAEADKLYTEAGYSGRRTDRGAVYVIFGPPADVRMEISARATDPPIELWTYKATHEPSLSGRSPQTAYRFVKRGDLTVLWYGNVLQRRPPPSVPPAGDRR